MRVIRLETQDGLGVYRVVSFYDSNYRPDPNSDGIHFEYGKHFFGFRDIDQMLNWLMPPDDYGSKKEKRLMIEKCIGISEYEVDDDMVLEGKCQIAFRKGMAKRLCWIPIEEMIS